MNYLVEEQFIGLKCGLNDGIALMLGNIYCDTIMNMKYFPVLEFVIAIVVGFILSIYFTIKKKNVYILDIYVLMVLANFALCILQCKPIMYRANASWALFVSVVVITLYFIVAQKKYFKKVVFLLVALIILWQTKDMNQWFYSEWMKYQIDIKNGYQIAEDIIKVAKDSSKPIVFVGKPRQGFRIKGQKGAQSNGLSVIWWGVDAFDDNSYELIKFINSLGYQFNRPTDEQYQKGQVLANHISYEQEGEYIKEFEDIIVVNFNEKKGER